MNADAVRSPPAMLISLNGIGPEIAAVLWSEGLYRSFANLEGQDVTIEYRGSHKTVGDKLGR